jgi:HEAT repeat protein/MFS-type transporter involved in bile tolerance (Atg22 family)
MTKEPTTVEKMRGLPWGIAFSTANSVYCQLTLLGSLFVLYLNELGLNKTQIGALLSLFPFTALLALVIAPAVARWGYKRTFLTFYGGRKVINAFLLLVPWVLATFGHEVMVTYVIVVVAVFAVSRAIAMTAITPWQQEYIPNSVRGKYAARSQIFSSLAGFVTVTVIGYVIGDAPDLNRFTILMAAGLVIGAISVWSVSHIPGGAPVKPAEKKARRKNILAAARDWIAGLRRKPSKRTVREKARRGDMLVALRDRSFVFYLLGTALFALATGPLGSFLPLFMREQVGLSSGNVVLLQTGGLLGGLLSSYLWGWAADRYGSKPVMLSGVYARVILPVFWLLMPRQSMWSLYVALGIAFLAGVSDMGWAIGSGRLLFVSIVPPEKRTGYMAVHYAWLGIVGGMGNLVGGRVLDYSAAITGRQFLFLTLDPYTVLFVAGSVLSAASLALFRGARADSSVTTGEFAGMFLRGNPLRALESLVRFYRARDERDAITVTEQLGQTQSPLTVDELLEALADPRFYVRFEAIVSIARREPDERLVNALVEVLRGDEPALSVIAAWALGRMGDERAIEPLREGLDARYRSIRAHCVRSLGSLEDVEVAPALLERLAGETDNGLKLAYASALGQLRVKDAVGDLLTLLRSRQSPDERMEIALALARIVGDEHNFIQLLRQVRREVGTAASQAVTAVKKKVGECRVSEQDLLPTLDSCAGALAQDDLEQGMAMFSGAIRLLPMQELSEACVAILDDCAEGLDMFGAGRLEYVVLALHTMHVGFSQQQASIFARAFSIGGVDSD